MTVLFQQKNEDAVKQFIMSTLNKAELPNGSLEEILKDGIILCEYVYYPHYFFCITMKFILMYLIFY